MWRSRKRTAACSFDLPTATSCCSCTAGCKTVKQPSFRQPRLSQQNSSSRCLRFASSATMQCLACVVASPSPSNACWRRNRASFNWLCRYAATLRRYSRSVPCFTPLLLALQSGGVYFTTDVLQAASAAYHSALEVYNEAQSEVIQQVLDVAFTSVKRVVARGVSFCTNCRWVSQLCARY